MVVDADVDPPVGPLVVPALLADDEQRRRLHPAPVAPLALARREGREEPLRKVAGGRFVGPGHPLDDRPREQDVPLAGEPLAHDVAGPVEAFFPGERGGMPLRIDDPDLALLALRVGLRELLDNGIGPLTAAEEVESRRGRTGRSRAPGSRSRRRGSPPTARRRRPR